MFEFELQGTPLLIINHTLFFLALKWWVITKEKKIMFSYSMFNPWRKSLVSSGEYIFPLFQFVEMLTTIYADVGS